MLFNSIEFLIFFFVVFVVYWSLNKTLKLQNIFLLIASYFFYGWWDWRFLFLIFISSLVNFLVARYIGATENNQKRKGLLVLSLIFNLGLLGYFKYFNFFVDSLSGFFTLLGLDVHTGTLSIILPVGISFYTFQAMSYVIDVYRRQIKPVDEALTFFTFQIIFPPLIAGPIERASNLLKQIEFSRRFDQNLFTAGIFQVAVGFLRKVVIADNLAIYVDRIYGSPELYDSNTLILATVFYAFQIYFDFSGYSDIAIGIGKLLGFRFLQNFNLPYFSRSLTEFWRKWHMSLSYWLRDYLYISLGGNRKGTLLTYRNLLITMLLGGLWHGSSWNFVIWGGIHGIILCVEKFSLQKGFALSKSKYFSWLGYITTFSIVCLAWIFFRAKTFTDAQTIITKIFNYQWSVPFIGDINVFINCVVVLFIGIAVDLWLLKSKLILEEIAHHWSITKTALSVSAIIILILIFFSSSNNFIYFQF